MAVWLYYVGMGLPPYKLGLSQSLRLSRGGNSHHIWRSSRWFRAVR